MRTFRPTLERLATAAALVALPLSIAWPRARAPVPDDALPDLRYPILQRQADLALLDDLGDAVAVSDCHADVRIAAALIDPVDRRDRDGEWVRLVNLEPVPVELRDWELRRGRRRLHLDDVVLDAGAALRLGADSTHPLRPLQLGNAGGELWLYDPCGRPRSRLAWGGLDDPEVPPGVVLEAPTLRRLGPTRSVTGGAVGGCGQT